MKDRTNPGGALTGATGDLTPDDPDDAFVAGERREVEDAESRAQVTWAQGSRAPAQRDETGVPGSDAREGGMTELAGRESGYGAESGLSSQDPAYRMEVHPPASPEMGSADDPDAEVTLGGDASGPTPSDRF